MEGTLGNLTEKQIEVLKQYRKNMEDILKPQHTDHILLKFLRAENFNLTKSEMMFRKDFYNRIAFGFNTILETYEKPEVMQRYETYGILGFAKDGTLLRYSAAGRIDVYGVIMSMSGVDLCQYFTYMAESDLKLIREENLRTGKNILEPTYIVDLEGFSLQEVFHKNVIECGINFLCMMQAAYPDPLQNLLIVNAPKIFNGVFNIFKPFFNSTMTGKIHFADKSSTKHLLLKYIDEDVLPAFLGGKRVDSYGDPYCKEFITFAGKIPEKFYSHYHRIPLMPTDPDVKCFTIRPRSALNHCVSVQEPGSKLRCQLRTNGSLFLTLFYKEFSADSNNPGLPAEDECLDPNDENAKYKLISHILKGQTHCTQEDAMVHWELPGIYIFHLSNATNWFTSRKGMLKTEIIPPKQKNVP